MTEVIDIVVRGGLVMIPLLACSLFSFTLTIERLLFWGKIQSQEALAPGTDWEALMRLQPRTPTKARIEIIPMIDTIFFCWSFS